MKDLENWAEKMIREIKEEQQEQQKYRKKDTTPIKRLYQEVLDSEMFEQVEYSDAEWGSISCSIKLWPLYDPRNEISIYWNGPNTNTFSGGSLEGEYYKDLTLEEVYELLENFNK